MRVVDVRSLFVCPRRLKAKEERKKICEEERDARRKRKKARSGGEYLQMDR